MVAPLSGEGTVEHIHFIVRVHQSHMTYRHPAVLAKMAATLDRVSGGRLLLGQGAGGSEAYGIPWRSPQERLEQLEDGIQLLRFPWSGQAGPFKSRSYGTVEGSGFSQSIQPGGAPRSSSEAMESAMSYE